MSGVELIYRGSVISGYRNDELTFRIEYEGPGDNGHPVVNQGWRLYEARWHKTRFGKPVRNQYPRWALIDVFETQEAAISAAQERYGK